MKQAIYGLILLFFLMLPPVITLSESIMAVHMNLQMPLLGIAGMLMTPWLQQKFPSLFEKWNRNGIPGMLLFFLVVLYWLVPRAMDEALNVPLVEAFKFFSWPFLAGVPLRDSWAKLTKKAKGITFLSITVIYSIMGWVYLAAPDQLCNNYLIVDQRTLGWSFVLIAFWILLFFVQMLFLDSSKDEPETGG